MSELPAPERRVLDVITVRCLKYQFVPFLGWNLNNKFAGCTSTCWSSHPRPWISCCDLPVRESYVLEFLRAFLSTPLMPMYGPTSKGDLKVTTHSTPFGWKAWTEGSAIQFPKRIINNICYFSPQCHAALGTLPHTLAYRDHFQSAVTLLHDDDNRGDLEGGRSRYVLMLSRLWMGPFWRYLFEYVDSMSKAVTAICSAAVDVPCK